MASSKPRGSHWASGLATASNFLGNEGLMKGRQVHQLGPGAGRGRAGLSSDVWQVLPPAKTWRGPTVPRKVQTGWPLRKFRTGLQPPFYLPTWGSQEQGRGPGGAGVNRGTTRTTAGAACPLRAHRKIPRGPRDPRGQGPASGLLTQPGKQLRQGPDVLLQGGTRFPDLPPHLAQPGTHLQGGGRRKEEEPERLPAGSGARRKWGEGPGTCTCSASSSSRSCALEATTCWEACRRVASVWLESRLARRRSCSPALSKALASCGG